MKSNNSPAKVTSRLLHNSDYFETLNKYSFEDWEEPLNTHIEKCMHQKCINIGKVRKFTSKFH